MLHEKGHFPDFPGKQPDLPSPTKRRLPCEGDNIQIKGKSSTRKTVTQPPMATWNRLLPQYAIHTATTKPAPAEIMLFVADNTAGKVMTVRVTYGT